MSSPRLEQKQQTRRALMEAARNLMDSGRGFGSLSLREVTRLAGIVPTGFYRHFRDMDELGMALVAEVGETFRATLSEVRRNEFELGGMIEASTRIFINAVTTNRGQFLFLAREQYGGSLAVRQALGELRRRITDDLSRDLKLMQRLPNLDDRALDVLADRIRQRGISSEQHISTEYLKALNDAYTEFFHYYDGAPLLIVNAKDLNLAQNREHFKQLVEYILTIKSGRHYYNPTPAL